MASESCTELSTSCLGSKGVVSRKIHSKTLQWLSYKQLCDKHGVPEANGLIKAQAVIVRQHPRAPEFFQFLDEDELLQISQDKVKELEVEQHQAIKTGEYKKMITALRASGPSAIDFETQLGAGYDDSSDDGDDDPTGSGEGSYLPKALKDLMGEKKKKKKAASEVQQKDPDSLTAAAGDKKANILDKAKQMLKLLDTVTSGPHKSAVLKVMQPLKKALGEKNVQKSLLIDAAKIYKKCTKIK